MGKLKQQNISIFCSISTNRLAETNAVLIPSIVNQTYNGNIFLTLINYSTDKRLTRADIEVQNKRIKLQILNPDKPLGFGESHNYAFKKIKPDDYFLVINPDVSLHKDAIKQLLSECNKGVGIIEARQLPFAHPKDFPYKKSFETNWASGSCMLINSEMFKKVNGFDPLFWMYLEDVDLSWRSKINGYRVIQNPQAVAYHFTGLYFSYIENSYALEDFWSLRNFLYISYKYWGTYGLKRAKKLINEVKHYNKQIKEDAINNFEELLRKNNINRIYIPKSLQNEIKVFGYNKFSKFPK